MAFAPVLKAAKCLFNRRLPKRGFNNSVFAKQYAEVNVAQLNRFEDGATVDPVALIEAGILKNVRDGIRILGNGTLETKNLLLSLMASLKLLKKKSQQQAEKLR